MTPEEVIAAVYVEVQPKLPASLKLTFRPANEETKDGGFWTGKIYGKQKGKIWYAKGGFYQVALNPASGQARAISSVSFGFYPNQKPCGNGQHAHAVLNIAERFCSKHPRFHHSKSGGTWFNIIIGYHGASERDYPVHQAAVDLSDLIIGTFPALDALVV